MRSGFSGSFTGVLTTGIRTARACSNSSLGSGAAAIEACSSIEACLLLVSNCGGVRPSQAAAAARSQ
ncbi:MAG: hypothetical protein QM775_34355 [Pirellulales bacterium]